MVGGGIDGGFSTLAAMSRHAAAVRMIREPHVENHGVLLTERLRLQPLHRGDLDALHALFVQPGVRRYLFDECTLSREDTDRMLADGTRQYIETGIGLWGIRTHDSAQLIGFVCLWPFAHEYAHDWAHEWARAEADTGPHNELGFALDADFQERGYATEACRALVDYARDTLGWDCVRASTDLCNNAANRVLWRLRFGESMVVRGRVGPLRLFKLEF